MFINWLYIPKKIKSSIVAFLKKNQDIAIESKVKKRIETVDQTCPESVVNEKPKILIFAPEAGVEAHHHQLLLVAKTLEELGHEVWVTFCYHLFERCPVMGAHRIDILAGENEITQICHNCAKCAEIDYQSYRPKTIDLRLANIKNIENIMGEALANLPQDLSLFTFQGINFGRIASFELRLATKISHPDSNNPLIRKAWLKIIKSSVKSFLIVNDLFKKYNFTHLIYFNDYAVMLGAGLACLKNNGKLKLISQATHKNIDRRKCIVYPHSLTANMLFIQDKWSLWRSIPLLPQTVSEIVEDSIFRFKGIGSHVYSPPKDGRASSLFVKNPEARHIVAFTSSPDEVVGLFEMAKGLEIEMPEASSLFGEKWTDMHVSWINALFKFISNRPDLKLTVRIHPRESSNKREKNSSSHLETLKNGIGIIPENASVVWPEESISSYDIAESADLILTSWSTIGLEMARLGQPVVSCSKNILGAPDDDFHVIPKNQEEYFSEIEEMLKRPPSFGAIIRAYRWWHLFALASSVDLSDVIPHESFTELAKYRMPAKARKLERAILTDDHIIDINREYYLKNRSLTPENDEEIAIRKACQIVFNHLIGAENHESDKRLVFVKCQNTSSDKFLSENKWLINKRKTRIVLDFSREVLVISDGKTFKKHSPMASRLAFLGASHVLAPHQWRDDAAPSVIFLDSLEEILNLP